LRSISDDFDIKLSFLPRILERQRRLKCVGFLTLFILLYFLPAYSIVKLLRNKKPPTGGQIHAKIADASTAWCFIESYIHFY